MTIKITMHKKYVLIISITCNIVIIIRTGPSWGGYLKNYPALFAVMLPKHPPTCKFPPFRRMKVAFLTAELVPPRRVFLKNVPALFAAMLPKHPPTCKCSPFCAHGLLLNKHKKELIGRRHIIYIQRGYAPFRRAWAVGFGTWEGAFWSHVGVVEATT